MKTPIVLAMLSGIGLASISQAAVTDPHFSIDPASPSIDGNITPDDVLRSAPAIVRNGRDLGLSDDFFGGIYDDLNALSYGQDPISRPSEPANEVFFSVDRVAVGAPGSDVFSQAAPGVEEAHGDVFKSLPPNNSNQQFINEGTLGLIPGFFGDDLNALELDTSAAPFIYFSVDSLSVNGINSADILISNGTGSFGIFADLSDPNLVGLDPGDDLDALALLDLGTQGVLDPGIDLALFSISTFSPTAIGFGGTFSPADILFTDFTGGFSIWAPAAEIGLRADDELNALDTKIPVPSAILLVATGLVGLVRFTCDTKNKA